jgi:Domain of unknown function (DUF4157)
MRTFAQKPKANQQTTSAKSTIPGRAHFGQGRELNSILHLQRTIGNQAVQRLLETTTGDLKKDSTTTEIARLGHDFSRIPRIPVYSKMPLKIQAKLTVSTPADQYEQEADQVADSVMAGYTRPVGQVSQGIQPKLYRVELRPEDMVDSMFPPGGEFGAESPETSPTEEVQRSASGEAGAVTPHFEQSLQQATHVGGEALPSPTRSFMESRFGWDFSSVRVHRDTRANTLAKQVNARAFTLDRDIFFAGSAYRPDSAEGRRLLAHELTHVVQQSEGRISRQIQRLTSCSSYSGYATPADLNKYNCAGLATRTYQFIAPASAAIDAIMANFNTPHTPAGGTCDPGDVKFWLWEYDMHAEDDRGTVLSANNRDFHIVAGRVDSTGGDPTDVYSKNGRRPVYGPGTGPSFKPAARERSTSNDPSETPGTLNGRPVFKVRSNMSESISCAGCAP